MQKILIALSIINLLITGAVFSQSSLGESDSGFITSLPPDAPGLFSPTDEATQLTDTITVIWHSQIHAAFYKLQVSASLDFSSMITDQAGLIDTTFSASTLEQNTTYYWRVSASNVAGEGEFSEIWSFTTSLSTAVDEKIGIIPKHFKLLPAYPNPFNPSTTITYHLPKEADVSLVIYNSMGQSIRKLTSGHRQAGEYKVIWNSRNNHGVPVTSGIYICQFKSGSFVFTQKVLLMR